MFIYNAICVMSDLAINEAGTITSGKDRYMEWKTKNGAYENTQHAQFDTFFEGMFQRKRLLDIIKNFICFSNEGIKSFKILAAYHQYFAVRKAIESTKHAAVTDGKGGVFWHTQGSGKSLSMVFYAHLLQEALNIPTIVVITDRNDLDDQLYGQFAKCKDFLRQEPMHAESREHLKSLLDGRQANGIIFTTMQKFEESHEALSERRNIIVMADEAHRGQYGLSEKVDEKTGKLKIGTARIIRNSLPNATYIGFTGTPISSKDRSTREVFGNYIDIYDMTQAVEDGATRPVYYESRVVKLNLDEITLRLIDAEYDIMANNADPEVVKKSKRELGKMEAIICNKKGGVGKTATAVNLSAALTRAAKKVLVLDLDSQHNATQILTPKGITLTKTISDLMENSMDADVSECICKSDEGIDFIGSSNRLTNTEIAMAGMSFRETILKRLLADIQNNYDYIIIDCPPSVGLMTLNALSAADGVIIPIKSNDFSSLDGFAELIKYIKLTKSQINPNLSVAGILLTYYSSVTNIAKVVCEQVESIKAVPILKTKIRLSTTVAETPAVRKTLFQYKPNNKAAVDYENLAKEVMELYELKEIANGCG